jgi:hypothetical protein
VTFNVWVVVAWLEVLVCQFITARHVAVARTGKCVILLFLLPAVHALFTCGERIFQRYSLVRNGPTFPLVSILKVIVMGFIDFCFCSL